MQFTLLFTAISAPASDITNTFVHHGLYKQATPSFRKDIQKSNAAANSAAESSTSFRKVDQSVNAAANYFLTPLQL